LSGISFFHPEFLWALAALSIPFLIHLLTRRPPRRFEFSTLRFFTLGALRKSKVRTLKRLLLLLCRLGMIVVIVAIFLTPFNRRDPFASLWNPDAAVYAFVDPTVSMNYRNHGFALWQDAYRTLDSLDKMLSPAATRMFYDEARHAFTVQGAFVTPDGLFTRHGPGESGRMIRAFGDAHRQGKGMPVLIALSDFQEAESRALDTAFRARMSAPVLCVSVAPAAAWDYRVADVAASDGNFSSVTVRVASFGRDLAHAPLTVSAGGMRVGHASVTVDKGNHADLSIPVTLDIKGHTGMVRLEADDPFPLDNEGYFVRGDSRAVRVCIAGDPAEAFSLAAAFKGLGSSAWNVSVREENDVSYGDIDSAALIVLCGVRHLSSPLDMLVHGKSFGPKAILFSPVTDSAGLFVNTTVLSYFLRRPLSFVADPPGRSVVLPDTLSALFSGFPLLTDRDARVYRYFDGLPGDAIVRLDNQRPLLTRFMDTLGNSWIMSATSLGLGKAGQPVANNLSETGLYVALLDRLCRHALSAVHSGPRTWIAGYAAPNPFQGSKGGAMVFDARNRLIGTWSRQPSVVFDEPGCYRIQPQADAGRWVVVAIDSSETSFSYRFPEVGQQNRDMVRFMTAGQFISFIKAKRHGSIPVWLWAVLGLLFIAEVLLWERKPSPVAAS
jgi:hypothetical protein